jgi:hypothetical protein
MYRYTICFFDRITGSAGFTGLRLEQDRGSLSNNDPVDPDNPVILSKM